MFSFAVYKMVICLCVKLIGRKSEIKNHWNYVIHVCDNLVDLVVPALGSVDYTEKTPQKNKLLLISVSSRVHMIE